MYSSETWTMTEADIQRLRGGYYEKNFTPINDSNGGRKRSNNEAYHLYKSRDIIRSVRITRLRWAGHVKNMEQNKIPKIVLKYEVEGIGKFGRSRLLCENYTRSNV